MATPRPLKRKQGAGECRECNSFCDKLVDPSGCIAMGCRYLYSYRDEVSGSSYMGCLQRVFGAEIDLGLFEEAEAGKGFGGIKMQGPPLPHCQFSVERSYESDGPGYECTNKRFFDCSETGPEGIRVFDLRNALD
ncbi:MAG: hypothetical protein ACKOPI_03870 [bacterium]